MNITVIGTGYVGLIAAICFADKENKVIGVDNDKRKIEQLKRGIVPFYEPGIDELLSKNLKSGTLSFTENLVNAVQDSDIVFIAVGTPSQSDGSPNMEYVKEVAAQIGKAINGYKIVVNKSTAPVGTVEMIESIIKKHTSYPFEVVSNPEFLKEGAALKSFLDTNRVIIGTTSERAQKALKELYSPFVDDQRPILVMNPRSAEFTKYAANAFLATKISFIDELANLSELLGANIDDIREGIGYDPRIGSLYMAPGIGYGGSCLPKDVKALIHKGQTKGYDLVLMNAVHEVNESQKMALFRKINQYFHGELNGLTIAVWGLSFKPDTDDMREAPSIAYINELLNHGVSVKAYDPVANETARVVFGNRITYCSELYEPLTGADALAVSTEWKSFKTPDFAKIKGLLRRPLIFDGRNIYNSSQLKDLGFEYLCIGNR
ncbi:UDP-glucose/GDP-mannose dehydrogenase family protein [bacterium]|nr:UDP-glucose/GDP-mannose dehydrogenase family protein [bacterium]